MRIVSQPISASVAERAIAAGHQIAAVYSSRRRRAAEASSGASPVHAFALAAA